VTLAHSHTPTYTIRTLCVCAVTTKVTLHKRPIRGVLISARNTYVTTDPSQGFPLFSTNLPFYQKLRHTYEKFRLLQGIYIWNRRPIQGVSIVCLPPTILPKDTSHKRPIRGVSIVARNIYGTKGFPVFATHLPFYYCVATHYYCYYCTAFI